MRIIGGHDYYDSAMALGHDPDVVFVRPKAALLDGKAAAQAGLPQSRTHYLLEPETGGGRRWSLSDVSLLTRTERLDLRYATAFFCGHVYTGLEAKVQVLRDGLPTGTEQTEFLWDWEAAKQWASTHKVRLLIDDGSWDRRKPDNASYFVRHPLPKEALARTVERRICVATLLSGGRRSYGKQAEQPSWRLNGDDLGSMQFWKVFDPYTAFQELEMWVGGVLPRPGNPLVHITDDKVRIHKAGFDVRTSFRNVKAG